MLNKRVPLNLLSGSVIITNPESSVINFVYLEINGFLIGMN